MAKQPFVPVAQVIRFRIAGAFQTAPWQNGYCLKYSGSRPGPGDMAILADAISTAWNTNIAPIMLTNCSVQLVQAWDLTDAQGAVGVSNATHAGALAPTNAMSVNAAVVVSWPVSDRWRGGHFRSYTPPRTLADIQNGRTLLSTTITAYKNAYQAWEVAVNALTLTGGTVTLGGVRYFPTGFDAQGKPLVKTTGQFRQYGIPIVHTRLDTQRRRLGKELV